METAGAGLEADEAELWVVGMGFGTVPEAGTAVDALLTVEGRPTAFSRDDGLAGAHFHTDFAAAGFAVARIKEDDVVGVAGGGLDFATDPDFGAWRPLGGNLALALGATRVVTPEGGEIELEAASLRASASAARLVLDALDLRLGLPGRPVSAVSASGAAALEAGRWSGALDLALEVLDQLHRQGISEEQLRSAKDYLKGQYPLRLETTDQLAALLADLEFFGLDAREVNEFFQRVDALTTADARRLIGQYFPRENLVITLIGKAAELENAVRKYAPLIEKREISQPGFK